ncbi:MAG: hypothetical protein AAF687_02085 [Pseudomonadota bacterium]
METWAIVAMFVLIFAGPSIWAVTDSVLEHRRKMAKIKYGRSDKEAQLSHDKEELKETVEMLQDRIAVLETIATDPARRTADEIEKLR